MKAASFSAVALWIVSLGCALTLSLAAASQAGAEKTKRPVKARVIATAKADNAEAIGNIEVTYADGSKDRWTTKGDAGLPGVAADGTVGWTVYAAAPKVPATAPTLRSNHTLVICRQGQVLSRAESTRPFIEEWRFVEGSSKYALKSRGAHGPATVELHDTATGKLLNTVLAYDEKLPKWAEPFKE